MSTLVIPPQALSLRHEIGDVVKERYTVREVLGAGAFGTVYRVEETIGSRLIVRACKEMHVLNDSQTALDERADALRMFQEEAYLLETLRNPHIPAAHFDLEKGHWLACPICGKVYENLTVCPEHNSPLQEINERYYLLMDFIEGEDLEVKLLARGGRPLEEEAVLEWALQVCDALQAVHAKGFSHRDIKPANIKIHNDSGQAMLIDFGLVRPSNVVGGYGTVLKRSSTGAGTIGYAPPSPQEQAQPDARTDILALGMTVYRLLTSRDPTEPADLEEMRRKTPRAFNSALSPLIEAIILKAIQPDPALRYPSINELRTELRAARYPFETACANCGWMQRSAQMPDDSVLCERCGRSLLPARGMQRTPPPLPHTKGPGGVIVSQANPYEARMKQIEAELATPVQRAGHAFDARIHEIETLLAPLAGYAGNGSLDVCPSCQASKLTYVVGQPSGQCPLCCKANLLRRALDPNLCPVCRAPAFSERSLPPNQVFCPVCHVEPLTEERRRRFGTTVDLHSTCPHCASVFDGDDLGATLTSVGPGVSSPYLGQNKRWAEWRQLAGRSERYFRCKKCDAQFNESHADGLTLVSAPTDPFGVAERTRGTTMTQAAWAKVALGLTPTVGTHHCPNCHGEFNYDRGAHTMTLLEAPPGSPDWATRWRGLPISLQSWYFAASGKRSMNPGLVCQNCHLEFDKEGILLKLVSAPDGPLKAYVGDILPEEDWQRRRHGLPSTGETSQLRAELKKLQQERAEQQTLLVRNDQTRRGHLENDLKQLLKQSIIEGFVPLQRMSAGKSINDWKNVSGSFVPLAVSDLHVPLRVSEMLRWESPGTKCVVRSARGMLEWAREVEGVVVVTTERVMHITGSPRGPQVWQRSLQQITEAQLVPVQDTVVLALQFKDLPRPIGLEVPPCTWDLIQHGQHRQLTMTPQDLLTLFYMLA